MNLVIVCGILIFSNFPMNVCKCTLSKVADMARTTVIVRGCGYFLLKPLVIICCGEQGRFSPGIHVGGNLFDYY